MNVDLHTWWNRGIGSDEQPCEIQIEDDPLVVAIFLEELASDSALDASNGSSLHTLQSLGRLLIQNRYRLPGPSGLNWLPG